MKVVLTQKVPILSLAPKGAVTMADLGRVGSISVGNGLARRGTSAGAHSCQASPALAMEAAWLL